MSPLRGTAHAEGSAASPGALGASTVVGSLGTSTVVGAPTAVVPSVSADDGASEVGKASSDAPSVTTGGEVSVDSTTGSLGKEDCVAEPSAASVGWSAFVSVTMISAPLVAAPVDFGSAALFYKGLE